MSVQYSSLGNGVRVVTHEMAHLETVSLGVWVASGARHETPGEHGISHFLEHMAFKGTERRDALAIAQEIENVGGELNAATSFEMTAYYARVLKADTGLALEILADILQNSRFDEVEMLRERDVILQEIAAANDTPDDVAYDLAQATAFPGQALGRPILGTSESVGGLEPSDLRRYLRAHYTAPHLVVSAAGGIAHGDIVRHVEALFAGINGNRRPPVPAAEFGGGVCEKTKPIEQSHLILGFRAPSYGVADYYALQVASGLLGGGISSRLFQQAREKRGLCYSIFSHAWGMSDIGLFAIYAGTSPDRLEELGQVIVNELTKLAEAGPGEAEVARAKAQLKAGLLMSLESSGARAEQMARQVLAYDRPLRTEELIDRVDQITALHVRDIIASVTRSGQPVFAHVGPHTQAHLYENFTTALA